MAAQRSIGQVGVGHPRVGPRVARSIGNALIVCGDEDVVERSRFAHACHDARNHRYAGNLRQGFLGKTRGTNASWDDSNKGG